MVSWLDAIERRAREAIGIPDEPKPELQRIARPPPSKPDIKTVWAQTRAPRDEGDPGECEAGRYSVAGDMLTLYDAKDRSIGNRHRLGPNDDPHVVAGRLTRAAWLKATGQSNFNRPLRYARSGCV